MRARYSQKSLICLLVFAIGASAAEFEDNAVEPEVQGISNFDAISSHAPLGGLTFHFQTPSSTVLRSSEKKVFAHYFTQFPISQDNEEGASDYYARHYLTPEGEGGKFRSSGGFILQRPLPRASIHASDWADRDMRTEITRAIQIGLDGFACDLLSTSGYHWERAKRLLDAADAVDSQFKVLLMPDMEAEFRDSPMNLENAIRVWWKHPSAMKTADGGLVVAAFNAQRQDAQWWSKLQNRMNAEGIPIALFPVFQGWDRYAREFSTISFGISDWGVRSPSANKTWATVPARAKAYGVKWMMPVSPQDIRPKNLMYWESRNSENYRVMWENAIYGGADWVQVISWNDYSEATEIAPSTGTASAFYELTAYYIAWFKTGAQPEIKRDAIYYFHRSHSVRARPDAAKQATHYRRFPSSDETSDDIEVVAFLVTPGDLRISVGEHHYSRHLPQGMSVYRVPVTEGWPLFSLVRNGRTVLQRRSHIQISNAITYQDLLYRGGGFVSIRDYVPKRDRPN